MTPTEEYIQRLQGLKSGDLGLLRLSAGKGLEESLPGFDLFTGLWWPLRARSAAAPRRETSWLVAKLYGVSPIPHVRPESGKGPSLAAVLGRCEPPEENAGPRFRARFDALLCSPLSALEPHLCWALGEIARAVAGRVPHARDVEGIDWVRLLDDLSIWDRGEEHRKRRDVRDEWAGEYLNAVHQTR